MAERRRVLGEVLLACWGVAGSGWLGLSFGEEWGDVVWAFGLWVLGSVRPMIIYQGNFDFSLNYKIVFFRTIKLVFFLSSLDF